MSTTRRFYMSSLEGYLPQEPHICTELKRLSYKERNDLMLVKIDPPMRRSDYNQGSGLIEIAIVASRHKGIDIFNIKQWPVFVHLSLCPSDWKYEESDAVSGDIESFIWVELYPDKESALRKLGTG